MEPIRFLLFQQFSSPSFSFFPLSSQKEKLEPIRFFFFQCLSPFFPFFTESKRKIGIDPIPSLPFSFLPFLYRVKKEKTNSIPNLSNISLLPPFSFYGFIELKRKIGTDPIPLFPMSFSFLPFLYRVKKKNWYRSDSFSSNALLLLFLPIFIESKRKIGIDPIPPLLIPFSLFSFFPLSSQKEKLEPIRFLLFQFPSPSFPPFMPLSSQKETNWIQFRTFPPVPRTRREEKGRKRGAVCAYANQPLLRSERASERTKKGEAARPPAIENEKEEERRKRKKKRRRRGGGERERERVGGEK